MRILLVAILAIVGIYLLGSGITGMVISQSCCFGESCPSEYLCDAAEPLPERPSQVGNTVAGLVLLVGAAIGLFAHRKDHH